MTHDFDQNYWDDIWAGGGHADRAASMAGSPPNPHLVSEIEGVRPGVAVEAGCGAGAEAIWLASKGWQVTAVDIAAEALERAATRAAAAGVDERISWQRADLSTWQPDARCDLVTTHYAHPAIPQLDFYERIADWVVPGGTLFIVGHLHHGDQGHGHGHGHGHGSHGHGRDTHPPAEASATAEAISQRLAPEAWEIVTATEGPREMRGPGGRVTTVHDVVVRAVRRA